MGYESIIGRAIFGKVSQDEAVLEVAHLYAVQRAIFCQSCGTILDVRKSVYFETHEGHPFITCGECYDRAAAKPEFPSAGLKVHDPRPLKRTRKPKVEPGQGKLFN
jgi:hypothetical protein